MKKITSFALIAVLSQILFVTPTFAKTKEEKRIEKVRTQIAKLGTGPEAKIEVKLKDGTKIKGYVTEAGQDQFVVLNSKTGENIPVPYPQVKQAKGNNLNTGAVIVIGIVGFLVLLVILASRT